MFPTFTGNSRRPRQVNLSGRRTNPFAATGSVGTQGALAEAQQERERRQRERDRTNATKVIQRTWRGAQCRSVLKREWRAEWDAEEAKAAGTSDMEVTFRDPIPYTTESESLMQLQRLLHFVEIGDERDVARLRLYMARQSLALQHDPELSSGGPWPMIYLRLQRVILSAIDSVSHGSSSMNEFLRYLSFTISRIPELTSRSARALYRSLSQVTRKVAAATGTVDEELSFSLLTCVLTPLSALTARTLITYEAFACEYLILEELTRPPLAPKWLDTLAESVNYKLLASSLTATVVSPNYNGYKELQDSRQRGNLLACLIYFHHLAHRHQKEMAYSSNKDYIAVISMLLSSVSNSATFGGSQRGDYAGEGQKEPYEMELVLENSFSQQQILSLVNQENISCLLGGTSRSTSGLAGGSHMDDEAKQLASFALTLLRLFPRKGDEIRMWLYLGSSVNGTVSTHEERTPAIKYFWQAVKTTKVFNAIGQDSEAAVRLLRPKDNDFSSPNSGRRTRLNISPESARDEWRVILLFFELYTFVLKLMDDEEFFSPGTAISKPGSVSTWAGQNALPLDDIKLLTTFLKNLGFTMYFNSLELVNLDERDGKSAGSISSYFSVSSPSKSLESDSASARPTEVTVAGLPGITIDYAKGLVTGLLRMLYERDSRRPFLPKGHWLMTSRFDMEGFIPAVVEEEEKRHKIQEEDDEDDAHFDPQEDGHDAVIGASHSARLRHVERLKRQQRKLSRMRYLQAVAPRLEILQNMPFFIPFETRVQIFREFVRLDQVRPANIVIESD
jgi:ubiquitin-protein ligase E3 C